MLQVAIVPQSVRIAHQADVGHGFEGFEGLIVAATPEVEGVVGLNSVLDVVGEVEEEVVAGDALDLIDREGVLPDAALAVLVGEDEADGVVAVVLLGTDDLEEIGRHSDLALQAFVDILDDRSAANPHLAITACPRATEALDLFPKPGVEFLVLRADVGGVVTFVHRLLTPLHVARGCHVTTRVTRIGVVVGGDFLAVHNGVGLEVRVAFAIGRTGLFVSQFPCHPVGHVPDTVVGDDVAGVLDDLLLHVTSCSSQFGIVGFGIGMGQHVGLCIG